MYGADLLPFLVTHVCDGSSPYIRGGYQTPKKTSEVTEQPLPPQNSMTESVCIIFWEYIFADNTFWSFLMFFRKKRDANGIPFSICPLVMTFFFVCTLPGFCTLPMSRLSLCSNTIPCVHCSRIIGRMDSFLTACLLRTS